MTTLPAIAWLLNLRGDDIAHNPVFYAYALVTPSEVVLWVQGAAVSDEVRKAVRDFGGRIEEYEGALEGLSREVSGKGKVVTDAKASWAVVDLLGEVRAVPPHSVGVRRPRAVRRWLTSVHTAGERRHRQVARRDGPGDQERGRDRGLPAGLPTRRCRLGAPNLLLLAREFVKPDAISRLGAQAHWQAWLEEELARGKQVTEWDAAEKLTSYRREQKYFAGVRGPPPSSPRKLS